MLILYIMYLLLYNILCISISSHPTLHLLSLGNPVMTFFIFYVAYRFGHLKLGPKDAQPEFSDVSYFAMLFSAGIVSLLPFRCEIACQKICIVLYS